MTSLEEWRERTREQEKKRIGDIYDECVKCGCSLIFLRSLETRLFFYPVQQSRTFIDLKTRLPNCTIDIDGYIEQWKIYLQVTIEKRPSHEKSGEWKEALEIIEAMR